MKRIVKYIAIDPYYSDVTQTYIGYDTDEVDRIQAETEEHMGREHPNGIDSIYKTEVVFDDTRLLGFFGKTECRPVNVRHYFDSNDKVVGTIEPDKHIVMKVDYSERKANER